MAKNYNVPKIEELLDAGVHFGHQVRRWNPKMEPYIYSVKKNIHVIDLEETHKGLKNACEFLYETAAKGGQIVLVGTKRQARDIVALEAARCGALHITERWLGGTITNYRMIKQSIDRLVDLKRKREAGELKRYTKKERLLIDREIEKLEKSVGGLVALKGQPDVVVVIDVRREKTAVRESNMYKVPVVALVDTNSNPTGVKYVIPGNDDAIKSIAVLVKAISDAIEAGYKDFAKNAEKAVSKVDKKDTLKKTVDKVEEVEEVEIPADAVEVDVKEDVEEEQVKVVVDEVLEVKEAKEDDSKKTKTAKKTSKKK
ncbi:MAG: 30S ribosomal protein S2 [Patescibacteria group bacterium]